MSNPLLEGLVVCSRGGNVDVEGSDGRIAKCSVRKKIAPVVCGDRVQWIAQADNQGRIEDVLPRRTELTRIDKRGQRQLFAANVDQLIIVAASTAMSFDEADPEPAFCYPIDRYVVAAVFHGMTPLIVLNKIDKLDDRQRAHALQILEKYRRLDYSVLATSTKTGAGLDLVRQHVHGRTSIFVGESGVGKSSLINTLVPDEVRTGAVSEQTGLGRHTTTATTLYHLGGGADLIDSPGVREYDLGVLPIADLADAFVEIRALNGECRFNDCRHFNEPQCAVRAAVDAGSIDKVRYGSYVRLAHEMVTSG